MNAYGRQVAVATFTSVVSLSSVFAGAIHDAAKDGDTLRIDSLVSQGVNVNETNSGGDRKSVV